jgi:hypothetical protein
MTPKLLNTLERITGYTKVCSFASKEKKRNEKKRPWNSNILQVKTLQPPDVYHTGYFLKYHRERDVKP